MACIYVPYAFKLSLVSMSEMLLSPCYHGSECLKTFPNSSYHSLNKENQKENKDLAKFGNGHFWPNYHDAHFEHPHLNFCTLSIMIFLHGL